MRPATLVVISQVKCNLRQAETPIIFTDYIIYNFSLFNLYCLINDANSVNAPYFFTWIWNWKISNRNLIVYGVTLKILVKLNDFDKYCI